MRKLADKKMRRRRGTAAFLSLLLIVTVVVSGGVQAAAAQTTDSSVLLMASMGVIAADASGNYNLSGNVTRGEFAKMLVLVSPYKDMVATGVYSSPFKDVAASDTLTPYIRLAVSNGLLSGYSDGTFRPNDTVTLEQAVNSVLTLLGYTQSDFRGSFPYAQMNTYASIGLSKNISGGTGTTLTRKAAVNLLYNLMNTTMKDGTQKYAETLGYTLNAGGEVSYSDVVNDNMNGPYTVTSASGWKNALGVPDGAVIYKDGSVISSDQVAAYDILYYSGDKNTVWVYSDKITGIYEKASPNQDTVSSVVISGTEYQLESSAAFAALSSTGTLKIGDAVTLLLGKNGGAADAVSASQVDEEMVIYVTETGTKSYEDSNNKIYTSNYIKGVTPSGSEVETTVSGSWVEVGDTVSVKYSGSSMNVSNVRNSGLSGTVNSALLSIGSASVAANVSILDTCQGAYTPTTMSRLDGRSLNAEDVVYYKAENGKITELILNHVTGDALEYGVVLSAESQSDGMSASGTYSYDIDGVTQTTTTQNGTFSAYRGPAAFYGPEGKVTNIRNLNSVGTRITAVDSNSVTADGKTYSFSPDVKVYIKEEDGDYRLTTLSAAVVAGKDAFYYYDCDRTADSGAQIRVIIIPE